MYSSRVTDVRGKERVKIEHWKRPRTGGEEVITLLHQKNTFLILETREEQEERASQNGCAQKNE